jgi:hypothetical protein
MLASSVLATVAFVGVVGPGAPRLERQLATLLAREAGAEEYALPQGSRDQLALRRPGAPQIVRAMEADAVVVARLTVENRFYSLRMLVYDKAGRVRGLFDVPLGQLALDRFALNLLRREFLPVVAEIAPNAAPREAPPVVARPAQPPPPQQHEQPAAQQQQEEEELPPPPPPPPGGHAPAAEVHAGDFPGLMTELSVGLGIIGRTFTAAPQSVPGYTSQPVGALRLDGEARPVSWLALGFVFDRALQLTTQIGDETAPSSLTRWQAQALGRWPLALGSFDAGLGVGQRTFSVESKNAMRTPDGDYGYAVLMARLEVDLIESLHGRVSLAYDPVLTGSQPLASSFGNAARWGFEGNLDVEFLPMPWLIIRAHGGWQRFSWSWAQAGARGAGGATDNYFDAVLSLGLRVSPVL